MSIPASTEQIIAANQAAFDTALSVVNTALNSVEKLASLNLNTARSSLSEQIENAQSLLGAKDLHQALTIQSALAQPQLEKAFAYSRSVYEISSEAQQEFGKVIEQKHAELNKSFSSALDWYAKSAGNSEVTVAAVKSAISAANSAFENANKASRQVAEITEASINAASSATVRAVGAANQVRKRAA